jgi:hypothetical protein
MTWRNAGPGMSLLVAYRHQVATKAAHVPGHGWHLRGLDEDRHRHLRPHQSLGFPRPVGIEVGDTGRHRRQLQLVVLLAEPARPHRDVQQA